MVTPQPVTKGERSVRDMPVKYTDEFPGAGFCPVDGGGNGIPFALNARTDADIFIGNASFLGLCTMFTGSPCNGTVELPAFIAVQDKGLVELRHFPQAGISDFRKLLQRQKYFMAHVESRLVKDTQPFCGEINGIAMQGVLDHLLPDGCREV